MIKKELLDKIVLLSDGALINTELLYKAKKQKARIKEIAVHHYERQFGISTGGNPKVILHAVREFVSLRIALLKQEVNPMSLNSLIVGIMSACIGLLGLYWSYSHHVILAYGDAEAHLNLAKAAISGLTPSITQIGAVWLPLPHIMMVPLVANNFLWRTGLGGSLISIIAFIWAGIMLYKLAYLITKNSIASYLAPLLWIANPNTVYLATTPMSEVLLFSCAASAVYYFIKWVQTDELFTLVISALFGCLASLSRYDGWFLVCLELFVVFAITLFRKRSYIQAQGIAIVYGALGGIGMVMWLLWNRIIFGNFLYFANSQYGSEAQQMWFYVRGYLPTYHNLLLSIIYYSADVWAVLGGITVTLSILGFIWFIWLTIKHKFSIEYLAVFLLLFPFAFYTISLYTGQASLILPVFSKPWYQWNMSNVRYGIQMVIPISIFVAFLASKIKYSTVLIAFLIIFQSFLFITKNNVIIYLDGTQGLSSQAISKGKDSPIVEKWLSKNYDNGLVLTDDYRRTIGPVESGIPMNAFIGSGNKPYWAESLDNPTKYAKWVVVQKADTDAVWIGMKNKNILEDHYVNVFTSGNIWVYKLRSNNTAFVQKQGQRLTLSNKTFTYTGVNIYDLLSQPKDTISMLLSLTKQNGGSVIRMWGFNKQGAMSNQDFSQLDFIINESKKDNLHLIIVFGNNWNDYGGQAAYLNGGENPPDTFFSNQHSIQLYEQGIKNVVLHRNNITGELYRDEPSIMEWELINEPRIETDKSSKIIISWIEEIGHFTLNLDTHHLISVGTEGFLGDSSNHAPYYENHGADYTKICQLSVIDICTAHLYPKYFKSIPSSSDLESLLSQWQQIAQNANKPFYLGEVGFDLSAINNKHKYIDRLSFLSNVSSIVTRKNITGDLLWNIAPNSDNYFSLSFDNINDQKVLSVWLGNSIQK